MKIELTIPQRAVWVLGLLSKRSHLNSKGNPKQQFDTRDAANKAALHMGKHTGREYDVYRCLRCRKFHFGGSVKTNKKR